MITYQIKSDDCVLRAYASEAEKDQVIVFLHGGPGSGAEAIYSLPTFQALEEDYRCVYFDQRGCGNSIYDLKQGLAISQICEDVACVIQDTISRFHAKQVFLWGGSFGGTLACLYMEQNGSGIDGLILNNPAIMFDQAQSIAFFKRLRDSSLKRMPAGFMKEEAPQVKPTIIIPKEELSKKEFVDFVYSPYNPSKSLRHICAMADWFFDHYCHCVFEQLRIPTLLLLGKEDPICSNADTQKAVEQIQNPCVDLQVLSPCGHAIFEDMPDNFVALTKAFLQQHKK